MARRQKLTRDELEQYLNRICLPGSHRLYDVTGSEDCDKLDFLNRLQKHHLCKVPWENLVQHYSWHRTVHLRPTHLMEKTVKQSGRGGYCCENNFFFHLVLYSLGFQVYMAGSRIYHEGSYGGWTHVVNIVTIASKKYMLDSGFGGAGPNRPVQIEHGTESPQIAPAEMRLMYEPIPNHLDQSQRVWIYEHRYNQSSSWVPMYCFVDFEFTPEDVGSMNFAPWLNRATFFTHKVVCVRFTTDREIDSHEGPGSPGESAMEGEIDGSLTIHQDKLKWRRRGELIVELAFEKDEERVAALEKYFGIHLTEDDREAIYNTAAMIGSKATGTED